MSRVRFGDVVKEVKINIDRNTDNHEFYIAGEHMDSENIHLTRRGRFEGSDVGPAFIRLFKPGQILYGSRRTYLKKVAVADFEGITSNTTFVLETKDETKLLQGLLPFIMLSDDFTEYSIGKSKGSTNPYILFSDLAQYEFDLPEINEQKRLLDILLACDAAKEAYKKQIKATEELVKSQFIEMFADTPKGKLSDIATITMGQSPDGKTYNTDGNGMCFYQGKTEFRDLYIGEATTWTTAPTRIAKANDVLMSVRAPVGSTNIATQKCCLGRGLAGIRPIDGKSTTMFILYSMRSIEENIENMGVGSTFKAINKDVVYNLPIPLATLELQNRFVTLAEQSDKSKFELQKSIEKIDNLIKSLIQQN